MQIIFDNLDVILLASVFGIMAVIALWCVFTGLSRGAIRSTIRLLTVAVSAGVAVLGVSMISPSVLPAIKPTVKPYVENFVSGINAVASDLVTSSDDLVDYIIELVTHLSVPVLFAALFMLLVFLTWPVYGILKLFVPRGEGVGIGSRAVGAVIALVSAAVISICVLMPVTGYASYVSEVYPTVKESGLVPAEVLPEGADAQIGAIGDNIAVKAVNICGGDILFKTMTTADNVSATGELTYILETVSVTLPALNQLMADNEGISGDADALNLEALDEVIIPQLREMPARLRGIFADILRTGASKWVRNETFLGIDLGALLGQEIDESVKSLLDEFADAAEGQGTSARRDLPGRMTQVTVCSPSDGYRRKAMLASVR